MTGVVAGIGLRALLGGWLKNAGRFLLTPVGTWSVVCVVIFVSTLTYGNMRYSAGLTAGRAEVQEQIDMPVVGWAARLEACGRNTDTLQASIRERNATITAQSREATDKLKTQERMVDGLRGQLGTAQRQATAVMRPLVGIDTCARVLEVDRRFVETLR